LAGGPSASIETNAGLVSGTGTAYQPPRFVPLDLEALVSVRPKLVSFEVVAAHLSALVEVIRLDAAVTSPDLFADVEVEPKMLAEVR
jgi:hypothetical protein